MLSLSFLKDGIKIPFFKRALSRWAHLTISGFVLYENASKIFFFIWIRKSQISFFFFQINKRNISGPYPLNCMCIFESVFLFQKYGINFKCYSRHFRRARILRLLGVWLRIHPSRTVTFFGCFHHVVFITKSNIN